eukprot:g26132.t1
MGTKTLGKCCTVGAAVFAMRLRPHFQTQVDVIKTHYLYFEEGQRSLLQCPGQYLSRQHYKQITHYLVIDTLLPVGAYCTHIGNQGYDMISITGYERNTESAKDAIMKIVADLEEMVSEDINLDHRVHARIIGGRGKAVRKIMEEFK